MASFTGLTERQVLESRQAHGSNALSDIPPTPLWRRLLLGLRDPMLLILLVALLVQLALFLCGRAEWYEPVGILVAILIANGVAAVFESRQQGKAADLRRAASAAETAKVIRDGHAQEVQADAIVVGDLVVLQAGDRIPADGLLVDGAVKVDQAALNGESDEATKTAADSPDEPLDRQNLLSLSCVYRGTVVTSGEGLLLVRVVGDQTLFGQAALEAQQQPRLTPLQLKLARLARQISVFGYCGAAAIALIVLLVAALSGHPPTDWTDWLRLAVDAVTVAVTIIVCAVPEGLPMLSSILQALQSLKMVRDHVLVRKLNGLETAGSLSILFSDKTGTITEGRLSVVEAALGDASILPPLPQTQPELLAQLLDGIGLNNSAIPTPNGPIGGNNTDRALMACLADAHLVTQLDKTRLIRLTPFDSTRKRSSAIIRHGDHTRTCFKGAPERLLPRCQHCLGPDGRPRPWTPQDRERLNGYLDAQASRSMRLLAVAVADGDHEEHDDAPLTLVCILSIRDNVRPEVRRAVQEIRQAGIQVVMVTGDRKETACAIAREAGLLADDTDVALTSFDLAAMDDAQVTDILPRLRVVARALPLDKSRLVRLAQELNLVVGMTGDGVNDAPALRLADVGFAMGSGTEVAKEAGDITILDDNLASIEKAILYGRTMFRSIRKFLVFQLTVNVAAVLICAIGPLCGVPVVLTVIQLLLVNLAMDTLAAIAFGSEPPLMDYMRHRPIPRSESIVTRPMMTAILTSALAITALCLALLLSPDVQRTFGITVRGADGSLDTSAIFATFMMAITLNGLNARAPHLNPLRGLGRNPTFLLVMGLLLALQFLFVTFGGAPLAVQPLAPLTWLKCLLAAALVIPLDLLRKLLARH
ncbi:MAG: calcium-translocating P-type ATPase, PMCA-type [Oligosphaeraceae bacterium]